MTEGPPFDHYEGSPAAMLSTAGNLTRSAGEIGELMTDVDTVHRRAQGMVDGDLLAPLSLAPRPVHARAQRVQEASRFTAEGLRTFGLAVTIFNTGVDRLNETWATENARDFGVPAPDLRGGAASPQRLQEAQDDYDAAVAAAREALREKLRTKWRALDRNLDDTADAVGRILARGPGAGDFSGLYSGQMEQLARLFSPIFRFTPSESYLPADPRENQLPYFTNPVTGERIPTFTDPEAFERYLRGPGAGAPIFYRVRTHDNGEVSVEYWFYRRYNDFRDVGSIGGAHPDDAESVTVRIQDGRPSQVGYSQHEGGCSLPYDEATRDGDHLVSYPGDGSAANSPYEGAADHVVRGPFGIDVNPLEELHGPAPGEDTPPEHVVDSDGNLVNYDSPQAHPWIGVPDDKTPAGDSNSSKFVPGAPVWSEECEPIPPRE
jgi:hypothetical protein